MDREKRSFTRAVDFLIFPLSQVVLLFPRFFSKPGMVPAGGVAVAWILALLCLAADAAILVAIRSLRKTAALQAQKESLDRQIRLQEEYCRSLADHYARLRVIRHDLANHVYTVKILTEDGRTEEAAAYIESLQSVLQPEEDAAAEGGSEA